MLALEVSWAYIGMWTETFLKKASFREWIGFNLNFLQNFFMEQISRDVGFSSKTKDPNRTPSFAPLCCWLTQIELWPSEQFSPLKYVKLNHGYHLQRAKILFPKNRHKHGEWCFRDRGLKHSLNCNKKFIQINNTVVSINSCSFAHATTSTN